MKKYAIALCANISIFLCTAPYLLHGARLIEGDVKTAKVFSFPLGPQIFSNNTGYLFVGAAAEVPRNEYALSIAHRESVGFSPLAVGQVTINGKENQKNPLTGAAIKCLSLLDVWPLVVTSKKPSVLHLIQAYEGAFDPHDKHLRISKVAMAASPVYDAERKPSHSILGLATAAPYIFVPIKAQASARPGFDVAVGSFVQRANKKDAKKGQKTTAPDDTEKQPNTLNFFDASTGKEGGNKAIRLDTHSPFIGVNAPVTELLSDEVNLMWASMVNKLYIPLEVTTGSQTTDAARALVLGSLVNGKLVLKPIAPDTAIGQDCIIGTRGASEKVSIKRVCPMKTSTWLTYLVGIGGVGESDEVSRKVFAVPLVYDPQHETTGMIAKKDQQPKEYFSYDSPLPLVARGFTEPATRPEDMPSSLDPAARVGQADAPGVITDITVQGDAVFVSIGEPCDDQKPGIFHSQALFDDVGRVVQWTRWNRVGGMDASIARFSYDSKDGALWYMPCDEQKIANTVLRTEWQKGNLKELKNDNPLSEHLNALFAHVPSGIKDLTVYPYDTPGFSRTVTQRLSLLIATSYQRVVLVETGNDKDGLLGPVKHFDHPFESRDGTLQGLCYPSSSLSITGGVLDELGPLVASAIVTNGSCGWLVVAGKNGVAILADDAGRGWEVSSTDGLGSGFTGLSAALRFVRLGAYRDVHTLLVDQGKLFIVTPTLFEGLELSPAVVKKGQRARGIPLAKSGFMQGHKYFLDAFVSGGCAMLATSSGMIFLKNFLGSMTRVRAQDWQDVEIPYSAGAVSRIFALNPVFKKYGQAQSDNIYIINSSASNDQARIYRYHLDRKHALPTLRLLPDIYTHETGKAFFMNLGVYRGFWTTDGAHAFLTGSAFGKIEPFIEVINIGPKTQSMSLVNAAYMAFHVKDAETIGRVVREPASGAWIAWGDFGVRFNA